MNTSRALGLVALLVTFGPAPGCDSDAAPDPPADSIRKALPDEPAGDGVRLLHTYATRDAMEVVSGIVLDASKLAVFLPAGYTVRPASELGFGGSNEGIVVMAQFRGEDPEIDGRLYGKEHQTAIDVGIVIKEPDYAAVAEVDIPGALHIYTLTIYTDDARYADSLHVAGMPVKHIQDITYDRQMNDATGIGPLSVSVRPEKPLLEAANLGLDKYKPVAGALDGVFWYKGQKGTAVLHFHDKPFKQGVASSQISARPGSLLASLISGETCPSDPQTSYPCVVTPALNFRYRKGSSGRLLLIE